MNRAVYRTAALLRQVDFFTVVANDDFASEVGMVVHAFSLTETVHISLVKPATKSSHFHLQSTRVYVP